METAGILSDIQSIFREVLSLPELELTEQSTSNDVATWDSLNHAILMSEVQKKFQIRFSINEILNMKSIGDLVAIVASKVAP